MRDDVDGSPGAKKKPASGCSAKMWILEIAAALRTADNHFRLHSSFWSSDTLAVVRVLIQRNTKSRLSVLLRRSIVDLYLA